MKTKFFGLLIVAVIVIGAVGISVRAKDKKENQLVVHEWGTFTSLQGADGKLIAWKPLQTSQLPKFVFDWHNFDLGLHPTFALLFLGKGGMTSWQRMETPVIYFYSDEEQKVDVSVKFPEGFITEWYPRASQIGPSAVSSNHPANMMVSQASESLISWSNLVVSPAKFAHYEFKLSRDNSGSHYFAARNTDADFVLQPNVADHSKDEYEKFLFYRGIANFTAPLRVSMKSDDAVVLANTGKEPLSHLFILGIKDKAGNFVSVEKLMPGEEKIVPINPQMLSAPSLSKNINKAMGDALVKAGLYRREATAMVDTWKDSWFAEDGLRVLYILPRSWTDRTLPMDLNPAPKELARVMVGRAEILRPSLEHSLAMNLAKVNDGDNAAADEARKTLHSLGRFAEPAFFRALATAKPQVANQNRLMALLNDAGKPE